MQYELNRKTLKILANEPTRTLLEKQLIDLCLRQYERLSQRDNDNNNLKQTLIRIQNAILSNCPWIVENTRMAKEQGRSQNAVHVAVVGIAPENVKQ